MVIEMFAQQGNLRKQEFDTNSMARTTEQAFRVTEKGVGEIHQNVRTRIAQVKQENAEASAPSNCPPERDEPMFDGKGFDGSGLGTAARRPLPTDFGSKPGSIAPYLPITLSDPPRYQQGKYKLFRKELLRRKDIHQGVPGGQLVGALAIKSEGSVKGLMAQYMETTRDKPSVRSMGNVILKLDEQLANGGT